MSSVRLDMIWQPESVLPYLFGALKAKIETVSPVAAMYLFGSRARLPVAQWHTLEGKDWDFYIVCDFPIVNTDIWGRDCGYYLDLVVITQVHMKRCLETDHHIQQLFPEDSLGVREKYIQEVKNTVS